MRGALLPTLLLAATALTTAAMLRLAPCRGESHATYTECELLKKLCCNKAHQIAENELFRTWQIFDDYDAEYNEYVDRTRDVRHDDSLDIIRRWMYPSQFGRLQRGLQRPYKYGQYNPQDEPSIRYYGKEPLLHLKLVYLRNKDILIENDQTYYVYDTYIGTINPFNFISARFLCRAASTASPAYYDETTDFSNQEELANEKTNEETNEIHPSVKDSVDKRDEVLDAGQKEVPDNLIFSEEEKGEVQKKLFALWSRMQSLTPKGRKLPARRHSFVFYGRDALSAETRAARLRPPGQPLRWG